MKQQSPSPTQVDHSLFSESYECRPSAVHLNNQINLNIKHSYFPKNAFMYNTFQTMLKREQSILNFEKEVKESLFDLQPHLNFEMRLMLLDWLCQVCQDYCLKRETFHRSIIMVDRFLLRCN